MSLGSILIPYNTSYLESTGMNHNGYSTVSKTEGVISPQGDCPVLKAVIFIIITKPSLASHHCISVLFMGCKGLSFTITRICAYGIGGELS